MQPTDALSALRVGEIDIALSNEWDCQPAPAVIGTTRIELMTEGYHVVLPPSHPLANEPSLNLRDLAHEPWCLTLEQGFRAALRTRMKLAGFESNVVLSSFNSRALVLAAEAGMGVSVVPVSADSRGSRVVLVPLAEESLTRHVFALVRAGSEESPPIRVVLDGMKEAVAASQTWWYETCPACGVPHLCYPGMSDGEGQAELSSGPTWPRGRPCRAVPKRRVGVAEPGGRGRDGALAGGFGRARITRSAEPGPR